MKKGWKITLTAVGSLTGLVLVSVAVVCWLVLTPSRLTGIANRLSAEYVHCDSHFERVDLTLFKTWPNVGLELKEVTLVNPYTLPDGHPMAADVRQNDTLAHIGSLTVGIGLRDYLADGKVVVRQLCIEDGYANLYVGPDGSSNFDIFPKSSDTSKSSTPLPDTIQLHKIRIHNLSADYCDLSQRMIASARELNLTLKGSWQKPTTDANLSLALAHALIDKRDSSFHQMLYGSMDEMELALKCAGQPDNLKGRLNLTIDKGDVALQGQRYTTEAMHASHRPLLQLRLPFHADADNLKLTLDKATVALLQYEMGLDGNVQLPHEQHPLSMNLAYGLKRWDVKELLAVVPPIFTQWKKGMTMEGLVSVEGKAYGTLGNGKMPLIVADVAIDKGRFGAPFLPMTAEDIQARLAATVDLSSAGRKSSTVTIKRLAAKAHKSEVDIKGHVSDLLGDMLIDATIDGDILLADARQFLPKSLHLQMQGKTRPHLHVRSRLSQITHLNLEKIGLTGTLDFDALDVAMDSLAATTPQMTLTVGLPGKTPGKVIDARVTAGEMAVKLNGMDINVQHPDITLHTPNLLDKNQQLAGMFDISFGKVAFAKDSLLIYSDAIGLRGSIRHDPSQKGPVLQWNPEVDIDIDRAVCSGPKLDQALRIPDFRFHYNKEVCNIEEVDIRWGVSDYRLRGKVFNFEDWVAKKKMLTGELDFTSQYTDLDQLMDILNGLGSDKDTLEQQRQEDNVPKEAKPFIVPKNVDLRLNTHINRCIAFGNDLQNLGGNVSIADGTVVLDQMGFTCKAARMQLTALYRSPRLNHLFLGLDFHLLDIQIEDLLHMIPTIDTLVPMLASFKGKANFHLAAQTNLDAYYRPKMSTLLGAGAISGEDLVLIDNEKVATMAKLLQLKNRKDNDNSLHIDSLNVEATVFRKEIEIFPFLLNVHNYSLCLAGSHRLDNSCNYHIEMLKSPLPVRLAVDVNGTLKSPNIKLGKVQYAEMYKPDKRNALQARTLEFKKMIREALEANVR